MHSVLHEGCHFICADPSRRASLHTDAGGDNTEECAVCYLSIALAADLPQFGSVGMFTDMNTWGYSFRLGNAQRRFQEDADDARDCLLAHGLPIALTPANSPRLDTNLDHSTLTQAFETSICTVGIAALHTAGLGSAFSLLPTPPVTICSQVHPLKKQIGSSSMCPVRLIRRE